MSSLLITSFLPSYLSDVVRIITYFCHNSFNNIDFICFYKYEKNLSCSSVPIVISYEISFELFNYYI